MQNAPLVITEELKQQLQATPGVLVYTTELRPELLQRITSIESKLLQTKAVTDQATADAANATLKEAKGLLKLVETEGMGLRRPFNEIAADIKRSETQALSNLSTLISTWNTSLTNFAKEQERKRAEDAERIRKETEANARAETDRINAIIQTKNKFHSDAIRTINAISTAEEADHKTANLKTLKFSPEIYQEFLPDMEELRPVLLDKIQGRKTAITEQIEIDKDAQAEELKQMEFKAQQEQAEATMSVLANSEMESELRKNMLQGAKSVQKRWVYKGFTDLSKVPIQYLCVDDKAVKDAIKSGHFQIPGLIIEQEISNVSR